MPGIGAGRIARIFEAAGWHTVTAKYGGRLRELFARDGGERRRIDEMPNEAVAPMPTEPVEKSAGIGSLMRLG